MTSRLKLAWQGMGGEEFFKPIYYAPALIPLLIGGIRVSDGRERDWSIVGGYFTANALGLLLCIGLGVLIVQYKNRNRLRFSPWLVIVIAIAIGALKAISTVLILVLLGLEQGLVDNTISRLFGAITASLVTIVFVSMFGAMRVIYSAEREKLLLSRVSREQPKITRAVFEELEGLLLQLRSHSKTSPLPDDSRSLIGSLLEEKIKPLSKEIWGRESKRLRSFDIVSLLRQTFFHDPYPALLIALIIPVVTPIWPAIFEGRWFEVFEEGLQVAAVWLAFTILNQFKNKISDRAMLWLTILMLLVASFVAGFVIPVVTGVEPLTTAIFSAIFLAAFLPNVAVVLGFGQSFMRASKVQQQTRQEEKEALDSSTTSQLEEILIGRELAAALHGKVQNRFVLSMARIKNGSATLEDELDEIETTIDQLKKSIFDSRSVSASEIIESFVQFLRVEISAPKDELTRLQARVVEEAISNAYRHGKAATVKVTLSEDEQVLIVDDDGFGPKEGPKGLGSYIFDSIGPWSIKALETGGTRFTLRFDS
ncbi:MAG TPA: hypothetical protein VIB80_06620 [Aquiluna sp.]